MALAGARRIASRTGRATNKRLDPEGDVGEAKKALA